MPPVVMHNELSRGAHAAAVILFTTRRNGALTLIGKAFRAAPGGEPSGTDWRSGMAKGRMMTGKGAMR